MENEVIEVLDLEHGQKVKKYWEDRGVDTSGYSHTTTKEDNMACRYFGVINGNFENHHIKDVIKFNAKIITLPEEKTFPRKMKVWNYKEGTKNVRTAYCIGFAGDILATKHPVGQNMTGMDESFEVVWYKYYEEIEEEPEVEISMQEIADKFNVSVDKLKIKK